VIKPNCVDPDPGMKTEDGSYALCVGRVSDEKGVSTLMKAWRQLPRACTLRVVGDGPARAHLQSEAAASGLSNITFLGQQPRQRVIEEMKGARFVVFPSELYENLPLTIIEAFACGTPVLASRLGAMSEIVEEGRTGLFFRAGDAGDLARVALQAWEQPQQLRTLGKQARREYENKYTAAANLQQLTEIYRGVIALRSAPMERLTIPIRVPEQVPPA
jgi:glycosyltransferase involved in cell wall biosynthesis